MRIKNLTATENFRYLLQSAMLGAFYFISGYASFQISVSNYIVTPVFFVAEGIALAAVILFGKRFWPGIFLGQFALATNAGLEILPSLCISAFNSIEAIIGATLFRYWKLDSALNRLRDLTRLMLMIFLVLQPFSATLGTTTLFFAGTIQEGQTMTQAWFNWWIGNCMGQSLVTPLLLVLFSWSNRTERFKQAVRSSIVPILLLLPIAWLTFSDLAIERISVAIVVFTPLLVWIAIKGGLLIVSLSCSAITMQILYTTAHGLGPFAQRDDLLIQDMNIFIIGLSLTAQFVSVIFAERKHFNEMVEQQHLRLANIIEGTNIGTWEWNIQTGAVVFNARWAEMIGYTLDELVPISIETWLAYAHPEDLKQSQSQLEQHFSGKIPYYECEVRMRHKKGHWIWVLDRGKVSSRTAEGKPLMMFGTHQDISAKKAYESMLMAAREQAEIANSTKSRFLAMMSHEIRTPMNAVLGMVHLLHQTALDPQQMKYLRNIENASNILLGVINDILDYSKIEANRLELESIAFDLNDVLQSLASIATTAAHDKNIDVLFYVAPDVPRRLIGDPLRLGQILINLTINAIKFTQQGEVIIRILTKASAETMVTVDFSVIDNGIGMTSEQTNFLFRPFYQADSSISRRFGGTGLGLAIARHLIEIMDGSLAVKSEYGKGSIFHFTVRLKLEKDRILPWAQVPENLQHLNVLIVDDTAATAMIILETIQSLNWNATSVDHTAHTAACLNSDSAQSGLYDLIIFNLHPGHLNPMDTARIIKSLLSAEKEPKIILLASRMEKVLSEHIEFRHNIGILTKPFTPSDMVDTVAALFSATDRTRTDAAHPTDTATARNQFSKTRVLVVEDNEINQILISEILGTLGITAVLAKNGMECLHLLEAGAQGFDLIFMDVQMPEMDGLETTRRIRSDLQLTDIPVIALTANAMIYDQQRCMNQGMNDFLAKPFTPEKLHAMLKKWLPNHDESRVSSQNTATNIPLREKLKAQAQSVIDIEKLIFLDSLDTDGNSHLLKNVLSAFQSTAPRSLSEIRQAALAKDHAALKRSAHTLKSSAANVGAVRLSELCRHMEADASENQIADVQPLIQAIQDEYEGVLNIIHTLRDEL